MFGGQGADFLGGGQGADFLGGGQGDDFISGGSGNDQAVGDNENTVVIGSSGNDTIPVRASVKTYQGQDGNDTFIISQPSIYGTYSIDGGTGTDSLSIAYRG